MHIFMCIVARKIVQRSNNPKPCRKRQTERDYLADVINMFRLEGVSDSIKSPLAPLFQKGGTLKLRRCLLRP